MWVGGQTVVGREAESACDREVSPVSQKADYPQGWKKLTLQDASPSKPNDYTADGKEKAWPKRLTAHEALEPGVEVGDEVVDGESHETSTDITGRVGSH